MVPVRSIAPVDFGDHRPTNENAAPKGGAFRLIDRDEKVRRNSSALGRPGSDLLSRVLRRSIIGAEEFNGRVRNGIGFRPLAIATKPAKRRQANEVSAALGLDPRAYLSFVKKPGLSDCPALAGTENESDQVNRAISTSKLHALPRFHTWPINVVVYHGSQGRTRFEVGFSLRCLQRLSRPYIATLHCSWRHNSSTRGTFIPVLSY